MIDTDVLDDFSAWEQLPESKLESMITDPKMNVLWEAGWGYGWFAILEMWINLINLLKI